jgi:pimeloyl-ACP methyl ester carboxylesterase
MSKVAVNGINLYYEEEGEGPPLVLISGYTTDMSAWDSIRHKLAKHFHLILVDNRGVGRSDSPDIPYSIEMMAEDIKALMDLLHLQSSYILAHSMGTAIAQTLAIKYPKLIKKMVLANPMIHFRPAPSAAFSFFLKMRQQGTSLVAMTEGVMPWLFSNYFLKDSDQVEKVLHIVGTYTYPQSLIGQKRQLEALLHFNSEDWFKKIDVPILVIEGEEDLICPGDAGRMRHEIPKASYLIFRGQAHMEHIEKADEFADAVMNFLI